MTVKLEIFPFMAVTKNQSALHQVCCASLCIEHSAFCCSSAFSLHDNGVHTFEKRLQSVIF